MLVKVRCPRRIDSSCRVDISRKSVLTRTKDNISPPQCLRSALEPPLIASLSDCTDPVSSQHFERCNFGLTAAYEPLGAKDKTIIFLFLEQRQ